MPPITIRIPTQAELAQMQQDPNSIMAVWNAANAAKATAGQPAPTNTPGASPGSNPFSQTVVSPVSALPTFTPQATTVTAPAPFTWTPINTPAAPQNNPEWIKSMSEMINQINQQAQHAANAARIPGALGLENRSSINIENALQGKLPADVITQIAQRAAERGVSSGNPYGANSNADYLRAIGLNSLQLQNTGQDWLTAALARNPSAPIYDPGRLVVTPLQQAEFALQAANFGLNQQQAQFGAYNANAQQNLQASLANASNASERDRILLQSRQQELERQNQNAQRQLQSDLANADTQFKRDQLLWQYQQNQLDRENAFRIAQLRGTGYGGGGSGGGRTGWGSGGGFNPATNWSSASSMPFSTTWSDPGNPANLISDEEWAGLAFGLYPELENFESNQGINWNSSNPEPYADYYNPSGGINTAGMSEEELDWLYNVGG